MQAVSAGQAGGRSNNTLKNSFPSLSPKCQFFYNVYPFSFSPLFSKPPNPPVPINPKGAQGWGQRKPVSSWDFERVKQVSVSLLPPSVLKIYLTKHPLELLNDVRRLTSHL